MCPFLVASTALFLACKVEEHTTLSVSSFLKNTAIVCEFFEFETYLFAEKIIFYFSVPKRWGISFDTASTKNGVVYDAEFILVEVMDCCLVVFNCQRPLVEMLQVKLFSQRF